MIKSYYVLLYSVSVLIIFSSCNSQQSSKNNEGKTTLDTIVEAAENDTGNVLPDLSVYHLPFNWQNQNGDTMQLKDLQGDVIVAVMIYTSCQASCPRLVADMKLIHDSVGTTINKDVKYVLVSIDPEVDTPERLMEFAESRDLTADEWVFLRGTKDDTRTFAATLSVNYKRVSPIDFAHSNIISVFDRNGVLHYQKKGFDDNYSEVVSNIKKIAEK